LSTTRGNPGGVYMCNQPNWVGLCTYQTGELHTCFRIPSVLEQEGKVQSIGPDQGASCSFYYNYDCTSTDFFTLVYPGKQDL
ncbi:hypothetical protein K469DRAFT_499490, partial [Zopfia rhizophila CBS 207.26]